MNTMNVFVGAALIIPDILTFLTVWAMTGQVFWPSLISAFCPDPQFLWLLLSIAFPYFCLPSWAAPTGTIVLLGLVSSPAAKKIADTKRLASTLDWVPDLYTVLLSIQCLIYVYYESTSWWWMVLTVCSPLFSILADCVDPNQRVAGLLLFILLKRTMTFGPSLLLSWLWTKLTEEFIRRRSTLMLSELAIALDRILKHSREQREQHESRDVEATNTVDMIELCEWSSAE